MSPQQGEIEQTGGFRAQRRERCGPNSAMDGHVSSDVIQIVFLYSTIGNRKRNCFLCISRSFASNGIGSAAINI